jgi:uncharacterized protein (TIGR02444 family)
MDNPFWDYSLAVYARDGVADALLALQDGFGLDVNLLLYAAWLADRGLQLEPGHLAALEARVAPWREQVIRPLRRLRRQWRDYPEAAALRDALKVLELQAEQSQQALIWAYFRSAGPLPEAPGTLRHNLRLVAGAGARRPGCGEGALEPLVCALGP